LLGPFVWLVPIFFSEARIFQRLSIVSYLSVWSFPPPVEPIMRFDSETEPEPEFWSAEDSDWSH